MRLLRAIKTGLQVSRFFLLIFSLVISSFAIAQDYTPRLSGLDGALYAGSPNRFSANKFKGKETLLMFWGINCPPCRVEIANFKGIKQSAQMPIIIVTQTYGKIEQKLLKPAIENGAIIIHAPNNFLGILEYFQNPEQALPYSVMFDKNLNGCISNLGLMSAKTVQNMKTECKLQTSL